MWWSMPLPLKSAFMKSISALKKSVFPWVSNITGSVSSRGHSPPDYVHHEIDFVVRGSASVEGWREHVSKQMFRSEKISRLTPDADLSQSHPSSEFAGEAGLRFNRPGEHGFH